jgi:hypothetical protein
VNLDTSGVLARGVVEDAGFATDDLLEILAIAAAPGSSLVILDFDDDSGDIYEIVFDGQGRYRRIDHLTDGVPVRRADCDARAAELRIEQEIGAIRPGCHLGREPLLADLIMVDGQDRGDPVGLRRDHRVPSRLARTAERRPGVAGGACHAVEPNLLLRLQQ